MKSGGELKLRDVTGKAEVWIDGKLATEKNDVMRSTIEQTEPSPSTRIRQGLFSASKMLKLTIAAAWLGSLCIALAQQTMPTVATNDTAGFASIFDGKSLVGWEGDANYWRVEAGCLVGEVTPDKLLKQNSFIIWHGGTTRDFELKAEYRISLQGNSGINYRSARVETNSAPFALRGYQADIDGYNSHTGQNYEERARTFLAIRGQIARVDADGKSRIIGSLGSKDELAKFIRPDWNEVHLIVRCNVMTHMLNGHVMSVVVDDDPKGRTLDGLLGVQVHVGPPMKVEYRNLRLKTLPEVHRETR